jgi:MFS family permease
LISSDLKIRTFTCIGVVPIAGQIVLDLEGKESKSASVLLVTIWELGEAAGPLLIAPLSEVYGRYSVFNCANVLFILWTVIAASSRTSGLFIFSRFMTGVAVASNVLNPAIIGDILPSKQRGSAMATLMFAPLLGGAVAPAIAGTIAQTIGWRQVLWGAALLAGVCELVFLLFLRETYKTRILLQRASRLRKEGIDVVLEIPVDAEVESTSLAIWRSIKRPLAVFSGSFVLQILSLYGAFMFTFFYIMSTSLPEILHDVYQFPPASTGSSFLIFSK